MVGSYDADYNGTHDSYDNIYNISSSYGDTDASYKYSDDPDHLDAAKRSWFQAGVPRWLLVSVIISVVAIAYCVSMRDASMRAWHRRQAAQAAARMQGRDDELMPVISWLGVTTAATKVTIELNGVTHTIGAPRDDIETVSRLPFVITEACRESGYPELAELDLVDLMLSRTAELSCVDRSGHLRPVDGTMSKADITSMRSFHVKVTAPGQAGYTI